MRLVFKKIEHPVKFLNRRYFDRLVYLYLKNYITENWGQSLSTFNNPFEKYQHIKDGKKLVIRKSKHFKLLLKILIYKKIQNGSKWVICRRKTQKKKLISVETENIQIKFVS